MTDQNAVPAVAPEATPAAVVTVAPVPVAFKADTFARWRISPGKVVSYRHHLLPEAGDDTVTLCGRRIRLGHKEWSMSFPSTQDAEEAAGWRFCKFCKGKLEAHEPKPKKAAGTVTTMEVVLVTPTAVEEAAPAQVVVEVPEEVTFTIESPIGGKVGEFTVPAPEAPAPILSGAEALTYLKGKAKVKAEKKAAQATAQPAPKPTKKAKK